jgi:predicted GNAT family N-acyltransferase
MKILITETQFKSLMESGRYINIPTDDIAPDIALEIWEEDEKLVLDTIVIPKELRKQGIGSKIMRMVCEYGDKVNKPIYLTPSTSFGGSSVSRLKEFYKRFGFVKNPESGPFRHVMVRYPV